MLVSQLNIHRLSFKGISPLRKNGFTLIEILVVVIIAGVLAAVSLPNFMSQIGKARQTEAKMYLSSLGMAQQAYFFEHQTFSNSIEALEVTFKEGYYHFPEPTLVSAVVVKQEAQPRDADNLNIRHYEMGVYYSNFTYTITLCQSANPSLLVQVADTVAGNCVNGIKLE
jgi:type IV pilus assembly protein PilA